MGRYILKHLTQLVPVLLLVSIIVFSLLHLIPGDVVDVMMGEGHDDPMAQEALRKKLGLDVLMAFPGILLAVALVAVLQPASPVS